MIVEEAQEIPLSTTNKFDKQAPDT